MAFMDEDSPEIAKKNIPSVSSVSTCFVHHIAACVLRLSGAGAKGGVPCFKCKVGTESKRLYARQLI